MTKTENIHETDGGSVTEVLPERGRLLYRLDSAQRREKDPTKHLALCLRMAQEQHQAPPAFVARQDAILRPRVRVAAKTEVAL